MMKFTTIVAFLLFISGIAYSQDHIYRKNGEVLKVKITEIGPDLIKYRQPEKGDDILFSIEKNKISKVVYANGETEIYLDDLHNPELYADQLQKAIKINFLSPLFGFTQFTYEQLLKPGQSYELAIGIIGLGKDPEIIELNGESFHRHARGLFFEGGMKFIKLPNFKSRGMKYTHIMQGSYLRPNLMIGFYSQNVVVEKNNGYAAKKKDVTYGGLTLDLGRQWVFGDKFLLDIFFGVGYAIDNIRAEDSDLWIDFVHNHFDILTSGNSGFGIRGGLKIGLLIK